MTSPAVALPGEIIAGIRSASLVSMTRGLCTNSFAG